MIPIRRFRSRCQRALRVGHFLRHIPMLNGLSVGIHSEKIDAGDAAILRIVVAAILRAPGTASQMAASGRPVTRDRDKSLQARLRRSAARPT